MIKRQSENNVFDIDIDNIREVFNNALACCIERSKDHDTTSDATPEALGESMQQFLILVGKVTQPSAPDAQQEMTELADFGLSLLQELATCALELKCDDSYAIFEQMCIPIALWAAQHDLTISTIELLVNALSNTANQSKDHDFLSELIDVIDVIVDTISPAIKADLDKSNPGRPWRILNLNQGIIATRSLDPKRMETVFEQLMYRLPDDVADFFAQGMEQMDKIDYPDHVRDVMQRYYLQTNKPTLH